METASLFDAQGKDDIAHAARLIVAHQETHCTIAGRDLKRALELEARLSDMSHLIWLEVSSRPFVHGSDGLARGINRFGHETNIHRAGRFVEDAGVTRK